MAWHRDNAPSGRVTLRKRAQGVPNHRQPIVHDLLTTPGRYLHRDLCRRRFAYGRRWLRGFLSKTPALWGYGGQDETMEWSHRWPSFARTSNGSLTDVEPLRAKRVFSLSDSPRPPLVPRASSLTQHSCLRNWMSFSA